PPPASYGYSLGARGPATAACRSARIAIDAGWGGQVRRVVGRGRCLPDCPDWPEPGWDSRDWDAPGWHAPGWPDSAVLVVVRGLVVGCGHTCAQGMGWGRCR